MSDAVVEDVMRLRLKLIVKPSDGLPNQEKNQYCELFIDRNKGFTYKTVKLTAEAEQMSDLARREINKTLCV